MAGAAVEVKLRAALEDERGLSVIELTIASVVSLVLLFAAFSLLDSGTRSERTSQARHDALLTLRGVMGQMTQETRQAVSISSTSNQTRLAMRTIVQGAEHDVAYEVRPAPPNTSCPPLPCALARSEDGGAFVTLSDRIVAPQAFCYQYDQGASPPCQATTPTPATSSIRISLELSPIIFSEGTVSLATDVQLRNVGGS